MVFFASFSHSVLLLFLSLILPILLSLYLPLFSKNMKEFAKYLGKCCSLFTIFTLPYLPPHLSLLLVSHFPVLATSFFHRCPICPLVFVFPFLLSVHLPFTAPVLLLFPLLWSLSFRQVIGALYLASYSHFDHWIDWRLILDVQLLSDSSLSLALGLSSIIHSCLITTRTEINLILIPQGDIFSWTKTYKQTTHIISV